MKNVTFEEFANFVRAWAMIPPQTRIEPGTQFERDLGITGDDGVDLLAKVQEQYNVAFTSNTFGLVENEYLFHSEASGIFAALKDLLAKESSMVRSFTIGELYDAVQNAIETRPSSTE